MKNQRASEQAASALPARFNEQMWQENDRRWWQARAHLFVDPECGRTIIARADMLMHWRISYDIATSPAMCEPDLPPRNNPLDVLLGLFKSHKDKPEPDIHNEPTMPELRRRSFFADETMVDDPNATQPIPIAELVEV